MYTVETSITGNYTVERADLWLVVNNASGGYYNLYNHNSYVGINGHDYTKTNTTFDARTTGDKLLIGTWDTTVYHNSDGTASIGVSGSHASGTGLGTASVSGTYYCDTIPRQANITSANDFTDEQNPYMTFNNAGGFSLNARLEFGGTSIQRNDIANTGAYTFVLTQAERDLLLSKCTTSNSLTVRYVVATKLNGTETWWSISDKTMTVVNANPTFNDFTYLDTNTAVVTVTGSNQILVKGKSTVRAVVSSANKMVPIKQSTAKNYVVDMDTLNTSVNYATTDLNIDLGILVNAGTKRLNVRAYDSRNNNTIKYKDILVYNYDKPVINATLTRLNNFEAQTTLKVSGTFSPLTINSVNKNTVATSGGLQYRYKERGGTFGSWTNLTTTVGSGTFTCTDVILTLDNTKAFDFEVKCVDKLDTTTNPYSVDVGTPILFIADILKSVGIGKKPSASLPTGSLDVDEVIMANGGYVTTFRGTITDFNTCLSQGHYLLNSGTTIPNAPYTGAIYGKLFVEVNDNTTQNNNNNWVIQTFIDYNGVEYIRRKINNNAWQSWVCPQSNLMRYVKYRRPLYGMAGDTAKAFDKNAWVDLSGYDQYNLKTYGNSQIPIQSGYTRIYKMYAVWTDNCSSGRGLIVSIFDTSGNYKNEFVMGTTWGGNVYERRDGYSSNYILDSNFWYGHSRVKAIVSSDSNAGTSGTIRWLELVAFDVPTELLSNF